jgi:lipoate-protein ligase A
VFHDLGNTNYSVALPTREFTRDKHAQMIARALCAAGVDGAAVNGRHDVIITPQPSMTISDDGVLVRKVSGSAYKITRERSYHHGTMLLSTDLSRVSALLRSPAAAYITARGVASVPSPVTNINLDRSVFINAVVAEFLELYALKENEEAGICYVDDSMTRNQEALWKGFEELKSPEWIYGQTPKFILRLPGNGGVLEVDKGHVTAASMIPEEVVGMKFGGAVVRRCMIASGTGEEDAIKWQNDIIGGSEWGSP